MTNEEVQRLIDLERQQIAILQQLIAQKETSQQAQVPQTGPPPLQQIEQAAPEMAQPQLDQPFVPGPQMAPPPVAVGGDTKIQDKGTFTSPLEFIQAAAEHRLRDMPGMQTEDPTGNMWEDAKSATKNIARNILNFATTDVPKITKAIMDSKDLGEVEQILAPFITFPVVQLGTAADAMLLSYLPNLLLHGEEAADKQARQAQRQIHHAPEGPAMGLAMGLGGVAGPSAIKSYLTEPTPLTRRMKAPSQEPVKVTEFPQAPTLPTGQEFPLLKVTKTEAGVKKTPVITEPPITQEAPHAVQRQKAPAAKTETEKVVVKTATARAAELRKQPTQKLGDVARIIPEKAKQDNIAGLTQAENAQIRKDVGLDKLPDVQRKATIENLNEAKKRGLDRDAVDNARRLLETGEPISPEQYAGAVIQRAKLKNEYNAAMAKGKELRKQGAHQSAELESMRAQRIQDDIDVLTRGVRSGRTEAARTMAAGVWTKLDTETYELAEVVQRVRDSKGGKPLTEQETGILEKETTKYNNLKKQFDDLQTEYAKESKVRQKLGAERAMASIGRREKIVSKAGRKMEKSRKNLQLAEKKLRELGFRVNDITGVSAEGAYWIGVIAKEHIKQGTYKFDELVGILREKIPEISDADIYRSIISKDPKFQKRARSKAAKETATIQSIARLKLKIDKATQNIFDPTRKLLFRPDEIKQLQKLFTQMRREAYDTGIIPGKLEKTIAKINEIQDVLGNHQTLMRESKGKDVRKANEYQKLLKELYPTMGLEKRLALINEKMTTGDYDIPLSMTEPTIPMDIRRARVNMNIARKNLRATMRNMAPGTWKGRTVEVINTLRTLKATADMSATFRQLAVLAARRPIKASKAFGKAFVATFNKYKAEEYDAAMRGAPHHYLREEAGLYLPEIGDIKLSAREEMFMSRLAEKIPVWGQVVKASERHMVISLNMLRASVFDEFVAKYPNATKAELKAWADWVNVASGRGNLGKAAGAADMLATVFFAPRFTTARIETPFMAAKYWKQPRVRKQIATDMVYAVGVGMTALALAKYMGAEVGLDPREADFGKILFRDKENKELVTRVDIFAGFQQPARLIARAGIAGYDRAVAAISPPDPDEKKERAVFSADDVWRLFLYKTAPIVGHANWLFTGKNIIGQENTPTDQVIEALVPIVAQDVIEAWREDRMNTPTIGGAAADFFGIAANTYENSRSKVRRELSDLAKLNTPEADSLIDERIFQWNMRHPDKPIRSVK